MTDNKENAPQFDKNSIADIWNEEMTFKMTRGTWADLLEGKIGRCFVQADGSIRVERRATELGIEPNTVFKHCPKDETI